MISFQTARRARLLSVMQKQAVARPQLLRHLSLLKRRIGRVISPFETARRRGRLEKGLGDMYRKTYRPVERSMQLSEKNIPLAPGIRNTTRSLPIENRRKTVDVLSAVVAGNRDLHKPFPDALRRHQLGTRHRRAIAGHVDREIAQWAGGAAAGGGGLLAALGLRGSGDKPEKQAAAASGLRSLLGRVGSALNPVPHFRDAHLARSLVRGGGLPVDVAGKLQSQQRKALLRGLKATGLATGAAAVPIGGAVAGARALTAPTDKNANEKTAFYACIGDRYIITKGEKRGKIGKCVSNTRNERCEEYVDDDGTKVTKRREDCTLKIELPDGSTYETSSPDTEVRSYYGEKYESDVESLEGLEPGEVKAAAVMDPENTTGRDKIAAMLRRVINGDEGLDQIINHLKAAKAKKALAG